MFADRLSRPWAEPGEGVAVPESRSAAGVAAMADPPPARVLVPSRDAPVAPNPVLLAGSLAIGIIVIAALYFGRDIFVPLALAILLSFALGPLGLLLRRWRFGRRGSVIASVALAFLVIFGLGALIGSQLAGLAEDLPQYESNITQKIHALRGTAAESGIVGRASGMLKDLSDEITRTAQPPAPKPASGLGGTARGPQQPPIPVEIRQPDPTALQIIQTIVGPLLQPLGTTGIVIIFVVFFLVQREDLRDRFIRLAGARDLQRTTQALDDAGHRLSRYLLVQTALNAGFGLLIGIGLWLIGIPNPALWGILAMLLRFVPYIGPVIAALFPGALALAVDPGWSMLLWTAAFFAVLEPITGQIVEPLVYGHSTGLSAVAVIVAAAFWTWLWGPVGLLLSTPLTLCLVVLGRHVERLEFLHIVLSDQPALTLDENFYQRMLANDPDEAAHQAETFLKDRNLADYYDEVAIKGLALAQLDVNRGALDHDRRVQIKEAVEGVIDDLTDHIDLLPAIEAGAEQAPPPVPAPDALSTECQGQPALCIAGRGARVAAPPPRGRRRHAGAAARAPAYRCPRGGERGRLGRQYLPPRSSGSAGRLALLPRAGRLHPCALPRAPAASQAAARQDHRRLLDPDGGGRAAPRRAAGDRRRSRRHIAARGGCRRCRTRAR
jgi:predicted PurR-regulated permease PerM